MARPLPFPASPEFERIARGAQFRDCIAIRIKATPEAVFRALQEVTLSDMRLARFIGNVRYLPARLAGHMRADDSTRPFLKILEEGGTLVLHGEAPREIITGSAGQLHRVIDQAPVRFASRDAFDRFEDADHEKLFMSVRVAPTGAPGEHWLVLEHATRALSSSAERKFDKYWLVIKPMGAFVSRLLLKAVRARAMKESPRSISATMGYRALLVALALGLGAAKAGFTQILLIQDPSVLRLRLASQHGEIQATGVLVHEEPDAAGRVLYVVTAARLLKARTTAPMTSARTGVVPVADVRGTPSIGGEEPSPVAVLRLTVKSTVLSPRPITFDAPEPGAAFVVVGHGDDGRLVAVRQRVLFRSTRIIVGESEVSELAGCLGAPALYDENVFGIVTECERGTPPVIALLAASRNFLARQIPGLSIDPVWLPDTSP